MTIEDARKAGELSRKLKNVSDALCAAKDARTYAFRHGVSLEVRFGEYSIEMVPVNIAEEALNLIISRLAERHDKITAEIDAM